MAYSGPTYFSSSKDARYAPTKAPVNVVAPPPPYGGYTSSSHYTSSHSSTTSTYPGYSTSASTPRSQPSSQYYHNYSPYSTISTSKSYVSNDTSGYASSHSSASSVTTPPPSSHLMYPASPKRPFPCDQCALSFDRSHDLKRHRDSHSGAKPFECASCRRAFTRKDALKRHQSQKQCGIDDVL